MKYKKEIKQHVAGADERHHLHQQAAMQQQILAMQEGAVVQGLILKLTDLAFDQCVDKPSNALKSGERACINSVVLKYLDTGKLIAGPPQRQAE